MDQRQNWEATNNEYTSLPTLVIIATSLNVAAYTFLMVIENTGNPTSYGIISYTLVGLSYSFYAAVSWPCISYLVPSNTIGTAIGINHCFQAFGVFFGAFLVGVISVHNKDADDVVNYIWVCALFTGAAFLATLCGIGLLIFDLCNGGVLMSLDPEKTKKEILEKEKQKQNTIN